MDVAREYCRRFRQLEPTGEGCEANLLLAEGWYREAAVVRERLFAGQDEALRQRCGLVRALAVAYAALGDRRRALDWVERAVVHHSANAMTIRADPNLASLRGDPRSEALAPRAGV